MNAHTAKPVHSASFRFSNKEQRFPNCVPQKINSRKPKEFGNANRTQPPLIFPKTLSEEGRVYKHNVFIESYYPTVISEFSEESELNRQRSDSYIGDEQNPIKYSNRKVFSKNKPQVLAVQNINQNEICGKSDKSETDGNRTYTVASEEGDWADLKNRRPRNIKKQGKFRTEKNDFEVATQEQNTIVEQNGNGLDAECFSRLHKRIQTLEELFQITLEKTSPPKKPKSKVKYKNQKDTFKANSSIVEGKSRLKETSSKMKIKQKQKDRREIKDHSDTEAELNIIKKRLCDLEKKMCEEKKSKKLSQINERTPLNDISFLTEKILQETIYETEKYENVKGSECSGSPQSEVESFCRSKTVMYTKVKKGSSKQIPGNEQTKKDFLSKCKKIKRKCSSLLSKKITKNYSNECDGVVYEHSTIRKKCLDKKKGGSTAKVMYLKCECESPFEPKANDENKRENDVKILKRKNSKINILRSEESEEEFLGGGDLRSSTESLKKELPKTREQDIWAMSPGYWSPYPFWMPIPPSAPCCAHGSFPPGVLFQNPKQNQEVVPSEKKECCNDALEILKNGGKIKIPVLFEEIQKKGKEKEAVRKASDISMRFVVVEKEDGNPLAPLRKLIKKLSRTHNNNNNKKTEQYVFGLGKCCCNKQVFTYHGDLHKTNERFCNFPKFQTTPKCSKPSCV